jgi:hypothetical protein
MKTRIFALLTALLLLAPCRIAFGQLPAKTLDSILELNADGSANLTFQMAFDAKPWEVWRKNVGDDPARLRGLMRHQFSALVIDEFTFAKDDLNRTAKVTLRSPAGPDLRLDGRYQIAVDAWCRLINHTGREWFFSGSNPAAGGQQVTQKIVLPANTTDASLVNAGTPDQALVYALAVPAGRSRLYLWMGAIVLVAGGVMLGAGRIAARGLAPAAPSAPPPTR